MSSQQSLHLFTAVEVAEELALRDAEMLRRIAPKEISNGAWMDQAKKDILAPNVLAMVRAFNSLALLVSTAILAEEFPQQRAQVISAYIKIAKKCYELKNYNSLNAVLAGMLCTPVYRLQRTWKEVSSRRKRQMRFLSSLMSEEGNWREYKRDLARQTATNTTCVIFLGVLLSQVVQYDAYRKLKRTSRSSSHSMSPFPEHKISMCETFTVLEAITVRNRLEQLRLSQGDGMGGGGGGSTRGRKSTSRSIAPLLNTLEEISSENTTKCFNAILCEEMPNSEREDGSIKDTGENRRQRFLLQSNSLTEIYPIYDDSRDELSPDLPGMEDWSDEVCREVDRRTRLRSQACSGIKRGRSLEQLLHACQTDDDPLTHDLEAAQSQSMPRLLSGPLQLWSETLPAMISDSALNSDPGILGYTPPDSPPLTMTATTVRVTETFHGNDVADENLTTNDGGLRRKSSMVPLRTSFATSDRNVAVIGSHDLVSAISFTRLPRKRYTASDELDLIQLQMARDEHSSDPAVLLKQYQVLSLGYSLNLTSSPYVRSVLCDCKPTTETFNYKRSYVLEAV